MTFPWVRSVSELQNVCRNGTRVEALQLINNEPGSLHQSFKGHYLIHEAAEYNNVEVLDMLVLRGADVNACTLSNRTPLIIAASKGHDAVVEKLMMFGADPFKRDNSSRTARAIVSSQLFSRSYCVDTLSKYEFDFACEKGLVEELKSLLEEQRATFAGLLEKGLHIASAAGMTKVVELLLGEGARCIAQNVSVASMNGHTQTASYLMLCSHALSLDANAIQNFTTGGRIQERGVDVDGAFAHNSDISSTELFFDTTFNLAVPVKLVLEGRGKMAGTDADSEACIHYLLLTKYETSFFLLAWDRLGLNMLSETWLLNLPFENVKELDISHNQIGPGLPDTISTIRTLQKFSCNNNALRELPKSLLEMPHLSYINAASNAIERLNVQNISQSLKNLNLSNNLLTHLPTELRECSLQTLRLSNNLFTTFPVSLCSISSLIHLEINRCKFSDIPNELGRLEELQHLDIPRISRLDAVQNELPKTAKILAFLQEKLYLLKPIYEMKMIVVGREGRGKTTLIRRLQRDYITNRNISTVGIQISKTRLQSSDNRKPFGVGNKLLTFHTWDFGGQQEYYATHQCFITPATLYLLVFSLERGVGGVDELRVWLGNISARAAGSTVIVVGTYLDKIGEEDCRSTLQEVDDKIRRWGFGNETNVLIPVITAVSCESDYKKTVTDLGEAIVREAERMRYKKKNVLGQLIPNSYIELMEEVNKLKSSYEKGHKIPVVQEEELWDIVRRNPNCDDIDSEYQFNTVTDLMHNLGIILHFKEPSLQNQYFLDPCWLCSMMGQVVTIPEKNPYAQGGILEQRMVRHMLKDKRFPDSMFNKYLRILNRFEIALKIDSEKILIPSLLPPDEDVTYSIPSDVRYFERQISFKTLPSGFIPRILVSTLSYILSVSDELCNPQFDRYRQFSGDSDPVSDPVSDPLSDPVSDPVRHAPLIRQRSNAMESRTGSMVHGRSFSSHASGDSFTSQHEAAQALLELSLEEVDVEDILIDEDGEDTKSTDDLELEEVPVHYELLKEDYLKCWRRGLSFTHPNLHLFILPHVDEEMEGILFVVSRGYMGRRALCHIIDTISMLVEDWYPGLMSAFCENQVVQKIPCPVCQRHTFTYDECLQHISESDLIACPNHPDKVKLSVLIPDIFLSDLEDDSLKTYNEIVFKESAESRLGGGAFGSVYKGMLRGQAVAIKTFNSFPMKPEAPYLELRREVNILKKMNNVCIVKMLAVCLRPTQCLVIEYAAHKDLEYQLTKPSSLKRLFLYKTIHQTACALAYLHKRRVIYRDIKPSNILVFSLDVNESPNVKLSDYGIAAVVSSAGFKGFHGTPGFQAPEMLAYQGLEEYTEAVDVYSFAFLLYEGICRKKAYSGLHRFDINRNVVANLRPDEYKSIRMTRFGMRNLKKLMEECWVQDHLQRPKMKSVSKMLCHVGYQMFMGHTMPPNAITARATCCQYNTHTQSLWVGCTESRSCKIMMMEGSTMDVSMLHDADLEKGCTNIRDIVQCRERMIVLGGKQAVSKIFRYYQEDITQEPELESITESVCNGEKHQHTPTCLAATDKFVFVGLCHGNVTRLKFDGLKESSKSFTLPTDSEIVKIFEAPDQNPSSRSTESSTTTVNKLMKLTKVEEIPIIDLVILTRTELFILTSDFKSVRKFSFHIAVCPEIHAVIARNKLFCAGAGSTYIQVFNLKKERASKSVVDLTSASLQTMLDYKGLRCTTLAATRDVLWVGTNMGAILFFRTDKRHRYICYIRPCVGDILTILPYKPPANLMGDSKSDSFPDKPSNTCPSRNRDFRAPSLSHSHSATLPAKPATPRNRHDRYNSNYKAGTFVCVCGMGRFAATTHLLTDTPYSSQGDSPTGLFALVLEEPPVEHIIACDRLYRAGGLL